MYVFANPNPHKLITDDCVIRAISLAEGKPWEDVYIELMVEGYIEKELPNANGVWGQYLVDRGFTRHSIPNTCDVACYTVKQFCQDHPNGTYILGTGTHAVCVIFGDWFDTFNSGDLTVLYFFSMED